MKIKLLLSSSLVAMSALPLALVSCNNPFKTPLRLQQAKYFSENNTISNNKSYSDFEQKYLGKYTNNPNIETIKKGFQASFVKFHKSANVLSLKKFFNDFTNFGIPLIFKINGTTTVEYTKEMIYDYIYYIVSDSPFEFLYLNKNMKETYDEIVTKKNVDKDNGFTIKEFFVKDSTTGKINKIANEGILPLIALEKTFNNTLLSKSDSVENWNEIYKETILNLKKLVVQKIDDKNEYSVDKAFAPLYYFVDAEAKGKFINQNYSTTEEGKFAFAKNINKLPKNFIYEFSKNPQEYIKKLEKEDKEKSKKDKKYDPTLNVNSKIWNSKIYPEFKTEVEKYQKLGKLGLSYITAFSIFYAYPKNIRIVQFKYDNQDPRYVLEIKTNNEQYYVDPLETYNMKEEEITKNANFLMSLKEFTAKKYTVDNDAYLIPEITKNIK